MITASHTRTGFSLVELSIVLVILGLLTGGILAGQSLIRAAELRAITGDISKYRVALQTFRDKYMALPGDMPNATSFWGVQHATPATCKTTASTSALTCNGDGNGVLADTAGSSEFFRAFQHMANAGLIEGSFSGITGAGGPWDVNPTNSPMTRISSVGISLFGSQNQLTNDGVRFVGNLPVSISFGVKVGSWEYRGAFLRAEEAWNIDTKLDDGRPGYGSVRGFMDPVACTTGTTPATAEYALNNSSIICAIHAGLQ